MMHIRTAVKVGVSLVVTMRTPEELAPLLTDALACSVGEPLPQLAAATTILAGAMWVHFDGTGGACRKGLLSGVLIDFAA